LSAFEKLIPILTPTLKEQLYGVGGAIRDHILKGHGAVTATGDIDLACSMPPKVMREAFEQIGLKVIPTGWKHGTITVLSGDQKYEITSFRSEKGYSDFRHPDEVVFNVTLEEDLSRRDFTMNALAIPLARMSDESWDSFLIDPFGGRKDIDQKVIRCVGNPNERFTEDPLRMLRACRFASQLDFQVHPLTLEAMAIKANLIRHVSRERIVDEINKLLVTNNPTGIQVAIKTGLFDEIFETKTQCQTYFKNQPLRIKESCSLGERWFLLLDWVTKAHDMNSQKTYFDQFLNKFPLANRESDLIRSLYESQSIISTIDQHASLQTEEEISNLRLVLSQIKQQGLDPFLFLRVHSVAVPHMNGLESSWVKVLSTNPPLLIEDLALKPTEIIEFYQLTPGSWIRSVQDFLLDHVLKKPQDNNAPTLRGLLHNYKIKV
jgi:tRNA nucleotidyltransferase (CCA-adding enzyme)